MTSSVLQVRQALKQASEDFLNLWQQDDAPSGVLADDVQVYSLQYGDFGGKQALLAAFAQDRANHRLRIRTQNLYRAGQGDRAAVSVYLIGNLDNGQQHLTFSGSMILDLQRANGQWQITAVHLQHGIDGGKLPHWKTARTYRRQWQPDDATDAIIPEIDSPWHKFPDNAYTPDSKDEQVAELYSRYAFAIDFADWRQLSDVFAADVQSNLPPMRQQAGHRHVYGQLRAFRSTIGNLLHMTEPLNIEWLSEREAKLLLGRVVSAQDYTPDGKRLYIARYDATVRQDPDGVWRYTRFNYDEGNWFTYGEE